LFSYFVIRLHERQLKIKALNTNRYIVNRRILIIYMKSLPIFRETGNDKAQVECAAGKLAVHTKCAFCIHCKGVKVGARIMPSPYDTISGQIRTGAMPPEALMEAALQFNTLVRDGSEIACNDETGAGYTPRFRTKN
jgi:hypothetical protein